MDATITKRLCRDRARKETASAGSDEGMGSNKPLGSKISTDSLELGATVTNVPVNSNAQACVHEREIQNY